jgi:hypothetical protein
LQRKGNRNVIVTKLKQYQTNKKTSLLDAYHIDLLTILIRKSELVKGKRGPITGILVTGAALVDWIANSLSLPKREEAVIMAEQLLKAEVIIESKKRGKFLDTALATYTFSEKVTKIIITVD